MEFIICVLLIVVILALIQRILLDLALTGIEARQKLKCHFQKSKPPSEEEKRQADKLQKELENFMRYDGTEQDAVE